MQQLRVTGSAPGRGVRVTPQGRVPRSTLRGALHVRRVAEVEPPQQRDEVGGATGSQDAASRCPVLSALANPPVVRAPWWMGPFPEITNMRGLQQELAKAGPVVTYQALLASVTYVLDGSLARKVFASEAEDGSVQSTFDEKTAKILGKYSLLSLSGEQHTRMRRLMQPTFAMEEVVRYAPRICAVSESWQDSWAAGSDSVDAEEAFRGFTFEIITNVVFGLDMSREELLKMSEDFVELVFAFADPFSQNLPFMPYGRGLRARERIVAPLRAKMEQIRLQSAGNAPSQVAQSVLEKMVGARDEDGSKLSDEEILDNMVFILFAGHDTTSHTLALLMMHLGKNPQYVQQLRDEQDVVVQQYGDTLTPKALRAMRLLDAVIMENLRLNPIAPVLGRSTTQAVEVGGVSLPQDTVVLLGLDYVARNDPRWADATGDMAPDTFNPNRFLQPGGRDPGWQIPFGYGPHACIGLQLAQVEIKIMVATLLRRWILDINAANARVYTTPLSGVKDVRLTLRPRT